MELGNLMRAVAEEELVCKFVGLPMQSCAPVAARARHFTGRAQDAHADMCTRGHAICKGLADSERQARSLSACDWCAH